MKKYSADKIRNLTLLGHSGSGKSSFAEAVLYNAGVINRMGKASEGNMVMDFDPEEIKRQISINTITATCEWQDQKINLIDTPGDFDFLGEQQLGMRVGDASLVFVTAKDGLSVGAEKAVRLMRKEQVPIFFIISKTDEPNANFKDTLATLKETYGRKVVPFAIPLFENEEMVGLIDLTYQKAFKFDDKGIASLEVEIPENMKARVAEAAENINEVIAETSEALMEKFFAGEEFTEEERIKGLKQAVCNCEMYPVFAISNLKNWGIQFAMRKICSYTPSALDRKAYIAENASGEDIELHCDSNQPLAAFVFKTIVDPFVGRISYFRVAQGKLCSNTTVYNPIKEKEERIGNVYYMIGKKQIETDCVEAGDIGAVTKLTDTGTNETLCLKTTPYVMKPIKLPKPCLSLAIVPLVKGEEDKIMQGLQKLKEEDLVFDIVNNAEIHQMILSGLGEVQLDVLKAKLLSKFKVESKLIEAKVPFRETIKGKIKIQGKHKKQSGGHGQYGDVWIEFEPGEKESLDFQEKIFGGSVPKSFHPAVEKGLQEAILEGVLAGYPVVNLKAVLVDGSYHDVDSSEMSFKLAAKLAYRTGLPKANPIILEPYVKVKVHIPEHNLGDIMGDLNKRRGKIMGIEPEEDGQVVEGEVPAMEMAKYATDVKSMTQGRGWFTISFSRYEAAPAEISEKVIQEAVRKKEEV